MTTTIRLAVGVMLTVGLAAAVILIAAGPTTAQTASASEVKAAFVYNLAKFSEWPTDALPAGAPLVLCVTGDDALEAALRRAAKGQTIGDRMVTVRHTDVDASMRGCQVVYGSNLDRTCMRRLIELIRDAPVLSVSDVASFATEGGVAELYKDGDRLRFGLNLESAKRARLKLSSKLLHLARIVKAEHDVVRR